MIRPLDDATSVLIVSDDAAAAALLGGLVETFGYRVQFSTVIASSDGLRRTRPRVAMLDCQSDCDEATVARALMRGVAVVLVGPRTLIAEMRELALRYDVEVVFTPPEAGPLGEVLHRAVGRTT